MKVLVACEESQVVTLAFRRLGHEAYSCDLVPCSGPRSELHFCCDVRLILDWNWDLIIAHPPCTYMSNAGARWMFPSAGTLSLSRYLQAMEAKRFFELLYNAPCPRVAVENPVPLRVVGLPQPSQVVQPYQFGDPFSKKTCFWLRGLPLLKPTNVLDYFVPWLPSNTGAFSRGAGGSRGVAHNQRLASRTFPGIAAAMAAQWSLV